MLYVLAPMIVVTLLVGAFLGARFGAQMFARRTCPRCSGHLAEGRHGLRSHSVDPIIRGALAERERYGH